LKVLKSNAAFGSAEERYRYGRNYGPNYGYNYRPNYYYPTTQASIFAFLNPKTPRYNERYYREGYPWYNSDDYYYGNGYNYYYTTPGFPFNLLPTTTTTTQAPFPLNLFQAPATEPPPPFPLNLLFPTTPKPFPFNLGK
jgi:hypothetical protein